MGQRSRSSKAEGLARIAQTPAGGQTAMAAGAGHTRESHYSEHPPAAATGDSSQPEFEVFESEDEIAMVRRAAEVLGIDHVAPWMRSAIPSLGNRTPYTLIKTEDGRNRVERVLMKIEHGVY
jgi:Protein of unknown function (DUF2384)